MANLEKSSSSSSQRWYVLFLFIFLFGGTSQVVAQQEQELFWPFSEIRADSNSDGTLDHAGKIVQISGVANIRTGLLHEHYLQAFVQNDSSGMSIFALQTDKSFEAGDSIVAMGTIRRYNGLAEVHVDSYKVFKKASVLPSPKSLEEAVENPVPYLGMLVEGDAYIVDKGSTFNGKYLRVKTSESSESTIIVYVSNFHALYDEFDFDVLSVGDEISVRGIVSEYDPDFPEERTFKLFLRIPEDLEYLGIPKYYMFLIILGLGIVSVLVVGWVLLLRRQVDRKTGEIQKSLEEKEVLLREIHHRVKNSLAIVSGLIELQLDSTDSDEAQNVLQNSQTRIRSMALIHEKLYQTESLSDIELDLYLQDLVEAIHGMFSEYQDAVELKFDMDKVLLDIDRVIPCGLLINELVVNAFKHAFSEGEKGVLEITLKKNDGAVWLSVSDNGPGLPDDFNFGEEGNLGAMLVDTFAAQLNADKEISTWENDKGSRFTFVFPE